MGKLPALLLLLFIFNGGAFGQDLMEVALKDRSIMVSSTPTNIRLRNYEFKSREFFGYLGVLKTEFPKKDTTELKKLLEKIKNSEPDLKPWSQNEISNKILVKSGEYIKSKKGLEKISWTTKEEKKAIIKEIRKYNADNTMWPNFPVYVSRPVYSESGKYAIIGIINGGSTGQTSLYKKVDGEWSMVADFLRWAY